MVQKNEEKYVIGGGWLRSLMSGIRGFIAYGHPVLRDISTSVYKKPLLQFGWKNGGGGVARWGGLLRLRWEY